jgi:hypothetical protein
MQRQKILARQLCTYARSVHWDRQALMERGLTTKGIHKKITYKGRGSSRGSSSSSFRAQL